MKLRYIVIILLGLGAACCQAEETEAERLKRLDANGDGQVDEQELREEVKRVTFASVDANGDGALSREEWSAADTKPGADQRFDAIDTNHDGRIDPMEFSDFIDQEFAQKRWMENMDADSSGYLTSDEVARKPTFNLFGVRF